MQLYNENPANILRSFKTCEYVKYYLVSNHVWFMITRSDNETKLIKYHTFKTVLRFNLKPYQIIKDLFVQLQLTLKPFYTS